LGFNQKSSFKTIGIGLLLMAATIGISGALVTLTEMIPLSPGLTRYFKGLEDTYMKQVKVLSEMSGIPDLIMSLLVMALAPAIFEEVFFRGGFQQMMTKATGNVLVSIIVTSILFSAIHFSFYGFLSRTAMGIALGFLFAKSGNLWIPILAHFFNNAVAVIQVYILKMNGKSIEEGMDDKFPLFVVLFAVPAIFYLLSLYKKSVARDSSSISQSVLK
jgi:membrane protease YdiL (CAAX protease family)